MLMLSGSSSCQRQLSPQAVKSIDFFNDNNFAQAFAQFKILTEKFPKDPLYQYYLGASIIELGTNPDEAVYYLKSAVTKNVNPKAGYYLARAYYYQFKYKEAREAYNEVLSTAKKQDVKDWKIQEELKRIERAMALTSVGNDFDVISKSTIRIDSTELLLKSWFVPVKSIEGLSLPENTTIYIPKNSSKKLLFFAAASKTTFSNKDIYKIELGKDGKYGNPVSLGSAINTEADEDFPIYIESENALYFASKNHGSIGGYDIFASKYSNGNWSVPEQLPFPINTPWDDYLFFADANHQYYFSNRLVSKEKTSLFQISPYQIAEVENLSDADDMLSFMNKRPKLLKIKTPKPEQKETITESKPVVIISLAERQKYINQSLLLQKSADSAMYQARMLRIELNNTEEKDKRNTYFANISRMEKKAAAIQEKANEFYKKLSETASNGKGVADSTVKKKSDTQFTQTKKNNYSKENPIPFDLVLPGGVIYRIQLGAFSKTVEYERFGGLSPISAEKLQDGKVLKYYVGIFYDYDKAERALKNVKEAGFKEAFIVSYFDNKKIPVERAKELEKTN